MQDSYSQKWDEWVNLIWFAIAYNFAATMALAFINYGIIDNAELPNFLDVRSNARFSVLLSVALLSST